jgi:tetratricopeptide (TPR) repeat protein
VGDRPGLSARARRTGSATGGPGSIVNSGVMYLDKRPVARSVYLRQVEQIFPFQLVGREDELTELAAFCTKPDGGPYTWWQGPAWAGKSALMAWFVQHPPPGVRLVSFFITARFADQSDRTAFLEVVLEQLAELAAQPVPDVLNESNKQAWFVQLLEDAASACAASNQRLVLLVDGLDEDRGVTSGTEPHSIAALLPADPPPDVRVIVAGRPNPPVPRDVPAWHPLRDEKIVRRLTASPQARMIRDDAERELDYLLDDHGLGRKLLGLVTVARGGLSLDDLVELSGAPPRTVDRTLQSVLGRTFRGRVNRWRNSAPQVFVLAHEELQQSAASSMSRQELAGFLGQLHTWAEEYQSRGWPAETPEYLLRGYHRLLLATGDIERMAGMATDRARLDRMLDVSGGDGAAVAEITAVQEFICGQHLPDLAALLNLAITRDRLVQRNKTMPSELPVAWAKLGNPFRGEALARSMTSAFGQSQALAGVAAIFAENGDLDRARQVIKQAEVTARSVTFPESAALALASVAGALARAGDTDQAELMASSITNPNGRASALTAIAEALAAGGDVGRTLQLIEQAEAITRSVTDPVAHARRLGGMAAVLAQIGDADQAEVMPRSISDLAQQAYALAGVGTALAIAGDLDRARSVMQQAVAAARSVTDPFSRACALASAARALAQACGDVGQARHIIQEADVTAGSITKVFLRTSALESVSWALACAGDIDRAETVVRSFAGGSVHAQALTHLAEALTEAGDVGRAREVIQQAEAAALSSSEASWQAQTLSAVAAALAGAGAITHAETIAHSIADRFAFRRTQALASVADALAEAGEAGRACQVIQQAEADARSCNENWQASALNRVARAWARAGDADRAEKAARAIASPGSQAEALAGVAETLARAGNADLAENTARSIADPSCHAQALASVAEVLAEAGAADRARVLLQQASAAAGSITEPSEQTVALASVARALAQAGDVGRARQVLDQAEVAARPLAGTYEYIEWGGAAAEALVGVTRALVRAGEVDQAEVTARGITYEWDQATALGSIAEALVRAGDVDRAEVIARSVPDPHCQATILAASAAALAEIPGTIGPPENPVISTTPSGERFHRLLASVLAQPTNFLAAVPLLARIEQAAVLKAAQELIAG